jgi:hypothetical protein
MLQASRLAWAAADPAPARAGIAVIRAEIENCGNLGNNKGRKAVIKARIAVIRGGMVGFFDT